MSSISIVYKRTSWRHISIGCFLVVTRCRKEIKNYSTTRIKSTIENEKFTCLRSTRCGFNKWQNCKFNFLFSKKKQPNLYICSKLKNVLNRDPSDEGELDRHGSTGQQLQTVGTDEAQTTSLANIKMKSKRRFLCQDFHFVFLQMLVHELVH